MKRIPEPELMNDPAQAHAYAHADFATPHQLFIETFQGKFPELKINDVVLDLGCGPCDVSRRFARTYLQCSIHAVDGASNMLSHAKSFNQQHGLEQRIRLIEGLLPAVNLPQRFYQTIISNSLLHHLHNPFVLWETILQYAKPFATIFIMDLMRPNSEDEAQELQERYSANEPEVLQQDFYHSLLAAFTPEEVQQQLDQMSISTLQIDIISDRHMIIYGRL